MGKKDPYLLSFLLALSAKQSTNHVLQLGSHPEHRHLVSLVYTFIEPTEPSTNQYSAVVKFFLPRALASSGTSLDRPLGLKVS